MGIWAGRCPLRRELVRLSFDSKVRQYPRIPLL
nr:MAG TPA: hypothetical protein [Caudoviricetes sp.]